MRSRRCKDERTSNTSLGNWEGEASNESEPEELPISCPSPASDMDRNGTALSSMLILPSPATAVREGFYFMLIIVKGLKNLL